MSELEVGPFVLRDPFCWEEVCKNRRAGGRFAKTVWLVGGFRVFRQLEGLSKGLWHAVFLWGFVWDYMLLWPWKYSSIAIHLARNKWLGDEHLHSCHFHPVAFQTPCEYNRVNVLDPPKQILWRPWRSQHTWVFGRFWRGLSKGSYHWAYGYVASIPPLIDISNCIFYYRIWEFNIADFESIPNLW